MKTKRFVKKIKLPVIVLFYFLYFVSYHAYGFISENDKKIIGFWQATIEGENFIDRFVYHFYENKNGQLKGSVYSFRNDKKKSKIVIDSLNYKDYNLYLNFNSVVTMEYKGYLIRENQTIMGKLFYPNGVSVPWTLKRIYIKSIDEIFIAKK